MFVQLCLAVWDLCLAFNGGARLRRGRPSDIEQQKAKNKGPFVNHRRGWHRNISNQRDARPAPVQGEIKFSFPRCSLFPVKLRVGAGLYKNLNWWEDLIPEYTSLIADYL